MSLKVFNTLGRRMAELSPLEQGHVRMYTCGPTVYNVVHIGNLRTFLWEDVLRRHLAASGYRVTQIMNLTDVDDKTIRGAGEAGLSLRDFTSKYAELFFRDIDRLGLQRVEQYPRATDHVPEMQEITAKLLERGHAYESEGSVYFRISTFPGLREALRDRPDAGPPRRPRGRRRVREGRRQGLRSLEGRETGRAGRGLRPGAGEGRAGTSSARP